MNHLSGDSLAAVASIGDLARRSVYDAVCASPTALKRDEIAELTGLARSTTAFHLERLVSAGLLDVEAHRAEGRTGPGAGRPANHYRRSATEVSISLPPRDYVLAAHLLSAAVEQSAQRNEPVRESLARVAAEHGARRRAEAGSLERMLDEDGYLPRVEADGTRVLGNCPFRQLAVEHTEVICAANAALLGAAAAGDHHADLNPGDGRCCVTIRPI